jgi:hypothetical protein
LAVLRARLAVATRDDASLGLVLDNLPTLQAIDARDLGLALVERTSADAAGDKLPPERRTALQRQAFGLLGRALADLPGDGAAACAFASLAGAYREQVGTATSQLAAARNKYPENGALALCTARMLDALAGDTDLEPYLLDALRWSNVPAQRLWAAQRLADLRTQQRRNAPL